ncbi:MAG: T9SS type A sorting domain-containing protein [Bacteroidota bacterium]|nr:T9SS type A sorting domain-containing protein [Bacteroidota bacterium]MDP4232555.1 T9SS type A sorting domain-containing protein [Bacteroidota bacterium]MDP4242990.1 T9SS type A sorting domain-containing protein [Bacteroidota bacterium]MDP4286435.1 T9SS type A sorting domain-containing protein [Bacteroidota bacterium]
MIGVNTIPSQAQYLSKTFYNDTVAMGDTALIARFAIVDQHLPSGCNCSYDGGLVHDRGDFISYITAVFFSPRRIGLQSDTNVITFPCTDQNHCPDYSFFSPVFGFGVSDSFPKIRPQGWRVTMRLDSNRNFAEHSWPTFDNPTGDTITFSEFTARPSNGALMNWLILDSITSISQYKASPFVRRRPLEVVFSSPIYESFDTILFSARIHRTGSDSVVSYMLPVAWEAPAAVSQRASSDTIMVSPNPFSDRLTIRANWADRTDVRFELVNALGVHIQLQDAPSAEGHAPVEIDTHAVPPGVYVLVIRSRTLLRVVKLVRLE